VTLKALITIHRRSWVDPIIWCNRILYSKKKLNVIIIIITDFSLECYLFYIYLQLPIFEEKKRSTDNKNVKHRACDFLYNTEYDR
jgi:hypothetical protein